MPSLRPLRLPARGTWRGLEPVVRALVPGLVLALMLAGCTTAPEASHEPDSRSSRAGDPGRGDGHEGSPTQAPTSPLPTVRAGVARYVALGDSYTAAPYLSEPTGDDGCLRSSRNYPALVAAALPGATLVDRSCAGAHTADVLRPQRTLVGSVPPQIWAVTARTDLVTIGLGGNDAGVFGTLVTVCPGLRSQAPSTPSAAPCRDAMRTPDGGDRMLAAVRRTEAALARSILAVRRRAPQARVLVVGYPRIVPPQGTCPGRLPLARGDYDYALEVNRALDRAVRQAARETGTTYVDRWTPSLGHDICAADPWFNGRIPGPSGMPYHPLAAEQRSTAAAILAVLGSLTR